MVALIVFIVLVAGLAAVLWWGVGLPPTRPRPRSRYRGHNYLDVHRRLEDEERRHRHP
ncbi:MAG TPA: hypothetical protein VEK76_00960 [Candidatus Binatia bacterium]|nr:hypothetical protein [Candidatus Binatia bacterium]